MLPILPVLGASQTTLSGPARIAARHHEIADSENVFSSSLGLQAVVWIVGASSALGVSAVRVALMRWLKRDRGASAAR